MSQSESMAIPMEGRLSKSELLELKNKMNARALAKKRSRTALRLVANVVFAVLILLPLLYAISIAFMPSNELFTTDLNLLPKHPTLQNFKEAFTTVPLFRFIVNSFIMAGCITIGQIISCSLAAFAFSFLDFKGKGLLFAVVMATMMVPGEATIISNYLTVGNWGMHDSSPKYCGALLSVFPEARATVESEIESMLNGKEDVDTAVQKMSDTINKSIKDYNTVNN